jgi:Protein of unknown function (DUF3696)
MFHDRNGFHGLDSFQVGRPSPPFLSIKSRRYENLFRRLQFLIADEHISPEDCRLYFVKPGNDSAVLRRLEVDEFGRIKNWPEKFFGDAIGEVERQTRRMIKRMAKRHGS